VLIALTIGWAPAHAFVRETTSYTTGTPLGWPGGCVVLAVPDPRSTKLAWQDLMSAATAAASSWTQAAGACGGGFRFDVQHATAGGIGIGGDGVNAVVFRTRDYCGSQTPTPRCDPLSPAVTWLYYVNKPGAPDDGDIYEVDIEINGEAYDWSLAPDTSTMDLETALVHELGHVVGLDHNCYEGGFGLPRPVDDQGAPVPPCNDAPADVTASVMYTASGNGVVRRALSDDDARAICTLYPATTPPACQGALEPAGCSCDTGGDHRPSIRGLLLALPFLVLFAARRRRRNRVVS
jgi:MYXO-CTERM domain-containing protein